MNALLLSRVLDTIIAAGLSVFAYFEAVHSVSICLIIFFTLIVMFNVEGYVTEQRMKGREW